MDPDFLAALGARLRHLKADTESALASLDEQGRAVEIDQSAQGRLGRIDAIGAQQMANANRAHLARELSRIDAALVRHAKGTYGRCCRCPELIDAARLRVDPAAPLCLDCVEEMADDAKRRAAAVDD